MNEPLELQPNLLLRAVLTERDKVSQPLRIVTLTTGRRLFTDQREADHVYFPLDCVISMTVAFADGRRVEVLPVGREGAIGPPEPAVSLPGHEVVVSVGGRALLLSLSDLLTITAGNPELFDLFRQYISFAFAATTQRAACYALHQLDQRLAMWLWLTYRRVGAEIPVTHGWLSDLMGSTRASVSMALGVLARQNTVRLRRGCVMVVEPRRLRADACDCLRSLNRFPAEG